MLAVKQHVPKIDGILSKMNIFERSIVIDYINNTVNEKLDERTKEIQEGLFKEHQLKLDSDITAIRRSSNEAWDEIDNCLKLVMRENHISEERMNKIFKRLSELMKETEGKSWFDLDKMPQSSFRIMSEDDLQDILAELIEKNCKGCISSNKDCQCHKILKRYNAPVPSGYQRKCKYAY